MKKFKKLISCTLVSMMVMSLAVSPTTFAQTTENDEIVYSIKDISSGNDEYINTTQQDITDGHWNVAALGENSPEIYKDFPVTVNKYVDSSAKLNIKFNYLKLLSHNDSASLTVTNRLTNEVCYTKSFAENDYAFEIENILLDNVYNLELTETFNGETATYSAVIETKRAAAQMPDNIYIDNSSNAQINVIADMLTVYEIADNAETEIEDEDGNIYVIPNINAPQPATMTPAEFQQYYTDIDNNSLYRIETVVNVNGIEEEFTGYFSKSTELADYGIFMPDYTFHHGDSYSDIAPLAFPSVMPGLTASEVLENPYLYQSMEDVSFTLPTSDDKDYVVIKFVFPHTGMYTIETVGNVATAAEIWQQKPNGEFGYLNYSYRNNDDFTMNIGQTVNYVWYFVIYFQTADYGRSIFRIKSNDYPDDRINSVCGVVDGGDKDACNVKYLEDIDYKGDVDSFYVDNSTAGVYGFRLTNLSDTVLTMKILERDQTDPAVLWSIATKEVKSNRTTTYMPSLNASGDYVVSVKATYPVEYDMSYEIEIISPTKGDAYEPNNSFAQAVDLADLAGMEGEINNITLHKGDVDYFKFTTGQYGSYFVAYLNLVNNIQYNMDLYKSTSTTPVLIASSTDYPTEDTIEEYDLEPSTVYYVCINNDGLGADAYTSILTTYLSYEIIHNSQPTASAVMSDNVTYSYSENDTVTSLDGFLSEIMDKTTCYLGTTEVADNTALNNIALYYMNGTVKTPLTADVVNQLLPGTYTVTVEYNGVIATGGTVTLTITDAPTGTVIELNNITIETVTNSNWDWAACAKMIANNRLLREGSAATTKTVPQALVAIKGAANLNARGTLSETASAADFFYTNGETGTLNFYETTINVSGAEVALLSYLNSGQAVALLLTSTTDTTDYSLARYVVLCGINTGTHMYKIMDPVLGTTTWVSQSTLFNGGYDNNSNLRFTGAIIEFL